MRETIPPRKSPRVLVIRALACLLLAASLAMLLMPWVSLRVDDNGRRVTLRELARSEEQRSGQSFRERLLSPLPEWEEGLYAGLLRSLDPLLDDSMSPLRITLSCTGAARWLSEYGRARLNGADPETAAWAQGVQRTGADVKKAAIFLWFMLLMLLLTGAYAIYSAAVGYGFGTVPSLVCGLPVFLGAVLAVSEGNGWYGGASQSARLLQSVLNDFSATGNPVSVPFRLGIGAILFAALLVLGVLLTMLALEPGRAPAAAAPAPAVKARPLAEKAWRCPHCGTLMGDGVYCVSCGGRKPEPRRCGGCGALLEKDALFCSGCGRPVGEGKSSPTGSEPAEIGGRLLSTMPKDRPETGVAQTLLWSGGRKREEIRSAEPSAEREERDNENL